MAVHDRPAAFEGSDGMSYSVEIMAGRTGEPGRPWGAFLLFLRWRRMGEQGVEGHLETDFLVHGATESEARARLGVIPLLEAKQALENLVRRDYGGTPTRKWWDVMREDADEE